MRLNASKSGQWGGGAGGPKKFLSKAAMKGRLKKAALRRGKQIHIPYKAPNMAGQVRLAKAIRIHPVVLKLC